MAYAYSLTTVLALLRQLAIEDLAAQGEAPPAVPFVFTAEQFRLAGQHEMPLTVIDARKDVTVNRRRGVNVREFLLPAAFHHFRARAAGASAETVALDRLAHIAARVEGDPRLTFLNPAVSISRVQPDGPRVSDEALKSSLQNVSIAHVELSLNVYWDEFLDE